MVYPQSATGTLWVIRGDPHFTDRETGAQREAGGAPTTLGQTRTLGIPQGATLWASLLQTLWA